MSENNPETDPIRRHTSVAANRRIDRATRGALLETAHSREKIAQRLVELDREWTVDRALMMNFAIVGGLSASMTMRRLVRDGKLGGWGLLFWTQMAFLAHHAIRRWCPPLPVFRRLGFRSEQEISDERTALMAQLADLEQREDHQNESVRRDVRSR
jgi:hypothetical protein